MVLQKNIRFGNKLKNDFMAENEITLTQDQRNELHKLWFIYGNNGKKHSHCNHRFIQNILEHGEDTESFYKKSPKNDLTQDCIKEVREILSRNIDLGDTI